MADQLQIRGGDTTSNASFTGAQRELSVDTTKNQLIVHDGVTPGGHPIPTTDDPEFTGDLTVSGSADFSGDVKAGERDPSDANARGVRIAVDSSNGGCYVQAKSTATASALMAFQALHGTDEKFKVMYDGSSVFSGGKCKINLDGSGQFGPAYENIALAANSTNNKPPEIVINGRPSTGSEDALRIDDFGSGTGTTANTKVSVKWDGSAEFAGRIKNNLYENSDNAISYVGVKPADRANNYGFAITDATNGNLIGGIATDGSATFASEIVLGFGNRLANTSYIGIDSKINSSGNAFLLPFWKNADGSNASVGTNLGSNQVGDQRIRSIFCNVVDSTTTKTGSVEILVDIDDDTKYTTNVDADGNETRVYNGTTLDVKDRLQKADAALKALKTAAAASTDFASLKSAIATALANI